MPTYKPSPWSFETDRPMGLYAGFNGMLYRGTTCTHIWRPVTYNSLLWDAAPRAHAAPFKCVVQPSNLLSSCAGFKKGMVYIGNVLLQHAKASPFTQLFLLDGQLIRLGGLWN